MTLFTLPAIVLLRSLLADHFGFKGPVAPLGMVANRHSRQ
jgi:hypothetical protein